MLSAEGWDTDSLERKARIGPPAAPNGLGPPPANSREAAGWPPAEPDADTGPGAGGATPFPQQYIERKHSARIHRSLQKQER
jgi:hypothetical protein